MNRRPTVELQAIISRERVFVSPPPAPSGTSLREWFAGLAMSNPELMRDIAPEARIQEALRVADQLIGALMTPRTPSVESMAAPTEEEMQRWDDAVAEANVTKERQTRATMPEMKARKPSRTKTLIGVALPSNAPPPPVASIHAPMRAGSIPPPRMTMLPREPNAGRYQVVMPQTDRPRNRKA